MIDCNNYEDKIISFIENELSDEEKAAFQLELDNNPDLMAQYNEMKNILFSLNGMPKVEASSDFIVGLNEKIDNYELGSTSKIRLLFEKLFNYEYLPQLSVGIVSLVCLFVVTYFWNPIDTDKSQIMLSNSSAKVENTVALNDSSYNEEDIDE